MKPQTYGKRLTNLERLVTLLVLTLEEKGVLGMSDLMAALSKVAEDWQEDQQKVTAQLDEVQRELFGK